MPLPGQEPLPDGAGGRGESHEDNTHGQRREDSVAFVCVLARAQPTAAVQLHKNRFERANNQHPVSSGTAYCDLEPVYPEL